MDYLVSTTWLSVTVMMFLLFMITGIWFIRPFRKWQYNRIMAAVCSVSFFAFIMYMLLGPNGYAENFKSIQTNGKQVCLVEQHERGDGDGGSSTWYRLYVLDIATGKRIHRSVIDYSTILTVKPTTVVFMENEGAVEYDLTTGDEVKQWKKDEGFEKYPELASGINYLSYGRYDRAGKQEAYLQLTAMNGKQYTWDVATEKLITGNYKSEPPGEGYRMSQTDIYYSGPNNGYPKQVYVFQSAEGEIKNLVHRDYTTDQEITCNGTFLQPEFLHIDEQNQYLIIKHYETLQHTNAIITCVDFSFMKKWEITQQQLDVADSYNESPEFGCYLIYQQHLLLTFGGYVLSVNTQNGNVEWKTRL